MPEYLNQLLADAATALVQESFTGVDAVWWWERRLGGGIVVCQELDPATVSRKVSSRTGRGAGEVRSVVEKEFGLEEGEPVVLTFEIPGDTTTPQVSKMLVERSATPEGLAANLYREVEEAVLDRGD